MNPVDVVLLLGFFALLWAVRNDRTLDSWRAHGRRSESKEGENK